MFTNVTYCKRTNFMLVDTIITFKRDTTKDWKPIKISKDYNIRFATITDLNAISRLAFNSFKYSRFHLDPLISNNNANNVKQYWITNFFNGRRGDWLVVCEIDKKSSGIHSTLQF